MAGQLWFDSTRPSADEPMGTGPSRKRVLRHDGPETATNRPKLIQDFFGPWTL